MYSWSGCIFGLPSVSIIEFKFFANQADFKQNQRQIRVHFARKKTQKDIRVKDTFDNQLNHFFLNSQNALCFTRVISGIADVDIHQHQSVHRHQALVYGRDVTVL